MSSQFSWWEIERRLGPSRGEIEKVEQQLARLRPRSVLRRFLGRLVRVAGLLALAGAVVSLAFVGLGPRLGTYRVLTVLSGSMRPTIREGSLVLVRPIPPDKLRVGHVITYQTPVEDRRVVTHRITEILETGSHPVVRTKGDANAEPDPWVARLTSDPAWRARSTIPYAGYAVNILRHPRARQMVPILLILGVGLWLIEIWTPPQRRSKGNRSPGHQARRFAHLRSALARAARRRRASIPLLSRAMRCHPLGQPRRWPVILTLTALLAGSSWAVSASFVGSASASHALDTATLQAPTNPAAAAGSCLPAISDSIVVSWIATASSWADGYEILRSTTRGGP